MRTLSKKSEERQTEPLRNNYWISSQLFVDTPWRLNFLLLTADCFMNTTDTIESRLYYTYDGESTLVYQLNFQI